MSPHNTSTWPGKEAPTDPFMRAAAGRLRVIVRHLELGVVCAAERPGAPGKARPGVS
jgi:hypothetical protein